MRKLLLVGAMFVAPHLAQADVIAMFGTAWVKGPTYSGYQIVYTFPPITSATGELLIGEITNIQLTFSGFVTPGVGGARYLRPDATISSVTFTPVASLWNSELPGNTIPLSAFVRGTPETLRYDNVRYRSYVGTPQFFTVSASHGTGFPADVFSSRSAMLLTLFTTSLKYTGSPYVDFPSEGRDRTTGFGRLRLVIDYNPVPEPASLAVLGTGLLVLAGWKRCRHSPRRPRSLQ